MANVPLGIDLAGCYSGDPESIGNAIRILTRAASTRQEAAPDIITPRIIVPASMADDFEIVAEDGTVIYPPQWQNYTPAIVTSGTAFTPGATTFVGRYVSDGHTVHGEISIGLGAGMSFGTGTHAITLPVTSAISDDLAAPQNNVWLVNSGTANFLGAGRIVPTAGVPALQLVYPVAASNALVAVSATAPFTWVSGDIIRASFTYPL